VARFHTHLSEEDKKKRDHDNIKIREENKKKTEEELVDMRRRQQEYIEKLRSIIPKEKWNERLIRRFITKADIRGEKDCWNWLAGKNSDGYGNFKICNKEELSHRVSYIIHNESIPERLNILHQCNNRKCINPKHLFLGTHQDNMKDMVNKNRSYNCGHRGEDNSCSKLTWKKVKEIREEYIKCKTTQNILSKKYNVSKGMIYYILKNINWYDEEYQKLLISKIRND